MKRICGLVFLFLAVVLLFSVAHADEAVLPDQGNRTADAAEADGKQQIARLMTPVWDGGFNTIWMSVPEGFTLIGQDDIPGLTIPDEVRDLIATVRLEKDRVNIQLRMMTSGRWMEYGNLKDAPEDVLKEIEAFYSEYTGNTIDFEVYETPGGLKFLRYLNTPAVTQAKYFEGWTIHNGYEIDASCWIDQYPSRFPNEQELQIVDMVLNSLEEFAE